MRSLKLTLLAALLAPLPAGAQDYAFRTVRAPGAVLTELHDLNSAGDVVGSYLDTSGAEHALVLAGDSLTVYDHPGATRTAFLALDDTGTLVGTCSGPDHLQRPFLLRQGVASELPGPVGPTWSTWFTGCAKRGLLVGYHTAAGTFTGLVWDGTDLTELRLGGPRVSTRLLDVSDRGVAVGERYDWDTLTGSLFLYDLATQAVTELPSEERLGFRGVAGINNRGQLVGTVGDGESERATRYDGAAWHDLDVPAAARSRAEGINDAGVVCGTYVGDYLGEYGTYGFVATPQESAPVSYCTAQPNSTGEPAQLRWLGSVAAAEGELVLLAEACPPGSTGVFLCSRKRDQRPFGAGVLCVGRPAGSFAVTSANEHGCAWQRVESVRPLLTLGSIRPGETVCFQYMYLDHEAGAGVLNFSDGLAVRFE